MNSLIIAAAGCFFLGILTTIHPCPFTTNIAAVSLLSGWSSRNRQVRYPFILFIVAYATVFIFISFLIGAGFLMRSPVSLFLQNSLRLFLGPVFILAGMVLTDLISLKKWYRGRYFSEMPGGKYGGFYALPMGILLALSFCPATAAIFFGLLIPLSVQYQQILLFPMLYALGAASPLIFIVYLITQGKKRLLNRRWQKLFPRITGSVLILIGIYMSIQQIFL